MKKYEYTVSSNNVWTSFDYGQVEANSKEEALAKAIEKLSKDFEKVNNALLKSELVIGASVSFDPKNVEVTLVNY